MRRTALVVLCCLAPLSGVRAQNLAWWVTWSIRPTASEVEGVPVQVLDPSWRRVSIIRRSDLPAAANRAGQGLPEDYGLALSVDTDLDGDDQDERVVVGAFETAQGELGRFLLILGRAKDGKSWTKKAIFSVRNSTPFSAVDLRLGTLRWHGCLECDDVCTVVRSDSGFRLRCESL